MKDENIDYYALFKCISIHSFLRPALTGKKCRNLCKKVLVYLPSSPNKFNKWFWQLFVVCVCVWAYSILRLDSNSEIGKHIKSIFFYD